MCSILRRHLVLLSLNRNLMMTNLLIRLKSDWYLSLIMSLFWITNNIMTLFKFLYPMWCQKLRIGFSNLTVAHFSYFKLNFRSPYTWESFFYFTLVEAMESADRKIARGQPSFWLTRIFWKVRVWKFGGAISHQAFMVRMIIRNICLLVWLEN